MRSYHSITLLAVLLLLTACGGGEETERNGPRTPGPAIHLLDRPPEPGELDEALVDPVTGRLLEQGSLWIVDEEVSETDWMPDDPPEGRGPSKRWLAKLRYPRGLDRCVVPIERLGVVEERRLEGEGRTRAERDGEAVLLREGALSLFWPRDSGAPPTRTVAYQASTIAVQNDLPSFAPGSGRLEAQSRILGEEARRTLSAPTPWSRTWKIRVPERAQLRFAWGVASARLLAAENGLRRESLEGLRCVGRVVLGRGGSARETLWQAWASSPETDRFLEEVVDLGNFAGKEIELSFEFEDTTGASGLPPLALLSEPVIDAAARARDDPPPDVLVILIDTLRADRLGCYGWERAHTPNIDRLAAEGVRFASFTSAAPWTLPSHASLFSSLYVSEHGIWRQESLAEEAITIAEVMREGSYSTAAFTEGAFAGKQYGLTQGFDLFQTGEWDVARTLERARNWIASVRGSFFVFVQTYQIHTPYDPPEEWREKLVREYHGSLGPAVKSPGHQFGKSIDKESLSEADNRYMQDLYDAEIAYTDACIGELLEWLAKEGRLKNTVVILTSDHGEEFADHGHYGHSWGLYDELLRVPLILSGPGRYEGGLVVEHPVHAVDFAPTLAALAGIEAPTSWSGIPLSLEPGATPRPIFTPFFTRNEREVATALRLGDKKFVLFPETERHLDKHPSPALFDLSVDPGERHNLFETERADPDAWIRTVGRAWEAYPERFRLRDAAVDTNVIKQLEALGYIEGE